jgi:hypothetical protein
MERPISLESCSTPGYCAVSRQLDTKVGSHETELERMMILRISGKVRTKPNESENRIPRYQLCFTI